MENSSYLGSKIGRIGNVLSKTAILRINEYQKRLNEANKLYGPLFRDLLINTVDKNQAHKTAIEFFGKNSINFVAVDGTEYSRPLFDMIVFFAGAYSSEGSLTFTDAKIETNYNNRTLQSGNDLSSCVPVFVDKIPEIDRTLRPTGTNDSEAWRSTTEQGILDNTKISNILMTFSEFYLAYKLATTKQYNMILMDRSLSNTYSGLLHDTSMHSSGLSNCSICDIEIEGASIDSNEIMIARHSIFNADLGLPPNRADYTRFAILNYLRKIEGDRDLISISKDLKVEKSLKQIEKDLLTWVEYGIITKRGDKYSLNRRYRNSNNRIKQLVMKIGDQIFNNKEDPFVISKGQERKWLTTVDLQLLTLFSLYLLMEECWSNKIILVGITKDTAAHDFKSHVLPVCICEGFWPYDSDFLKGLGKLPNSDRMFLQFLSISNFDKISIPWALIEYDSAFVTAIPDFKNRNGYVSGYIQNKIIPTKMFVKSYVQLQQSANNQLFRSNVMAVDRLVFSDYDLSKENMIDFKHENFGEDKLSFILFKNNKIENKIQNLIMCCLSAMNAPSIAEAFGHNKPLFIADKVAKWHNEEFRKIVDSTSSIILCDKSLRNFVFYMNSFREKRQELENNRRY